jgi:putative transposase
MNKYCLKPPRRRVKKDYLTKPANKCNYTNLIKDLTINQPLQILTSDLTYLKYQGRFFYMETVKDLFTKEILGCGLSNRHNHQLVLKAINQAVFPNHCPKYFHFDQGKENFAQPVTDYLEKLEVKISVSDKASPWQNGSQESFFGRFKTEMGDLNRFDTLGEFIEEIYTYIHYYNNSRIHTALKMPPAIFKQRFSDVETVSRKSGT